ncbi:MAG: GTP cyclohydrolase I FolE [Flavobacteriales bacterium]|nr:GTP cyclohydrolase I FolE [Flavobacteriales bacterium]|tara:strand:- start:760 stop:1356 length:597 start_codon:yes stop_codon:yes gene_type:complete
MYTKKEEYNPKTTEKIGEKYKEILIAIGENITREGLQKTPSRCAKAIQFLTQGYHINPDEVLKGALFQEDYSQMVLIKNIELYSLCEHHLVPFFGKAHIAYIPNKKIVGLSKIPRVVDIFSRRLQVQERLTKEISECLEKNLNPEGVAVVIEASHLCMQMRGVEKQNSITTTSSFTGIFLKEKKTRSEFMNLIQSKLA